jgi:hypothetical protein
MDFLEAMPSRGNFCQLASPSSIIKVVGLDSTASELARAVLQDVGLMTFRHIR